MQRQEPQGYGDFKFAKPMDREGEAMQRVRAELANQRKENERLRERAHALEEQSKAVETEKCLALKQMQHMK